MTTFSKVYESSEDLLAALNSDDLLREELASLRTFRAKAFEAHPNIDLDIQASDWEDLNVARIAELTRERDELAAVLANLIASIERDERIEMRHLANARAALAKVREIAPLDGTPTRGEFVPGELGEQKG